jgi:HSP20 family protein
MLSLQRTLDRLMDTSLSEGDLSQNWGLPLDVLEEEDRFIVKASIPGINPEEIEITYNNGTLTLRGEVKDERETEKGEYHLRERRYGSFARSISLPATIKADDIRATCDQGVLKLELPKTEEVKPRRIPVRTTDGNRQRVIEGK